VSKIGYTGPPGGPRIERVLEQLCWSPCREIESLKEVGERGELRYRLGRDITGFL